jgi:hypothetical protein
MVDDVLNEQMLDVIEPYIQLSNNPNIVAAYSHPLVLPGSDGHKYYSWVWNGKDCILECLIRGGSYNFLYRNRQTGYNWAAIYSLEDMICGSINNKDIFINLINTLVV